MTQRILLVLLAIALSTPLQGQGTWDAILFVDPVPSPYLSDWETNRTFGTLTVFNRSGADQSVRLIFSVVDGNGRLLASGASDPRMILADAPEIIDSPLDIAGSTDHDKQLESQIRRTGRLPEGDYRACIAVADLGGFQLAEACELFAIVYPDPPQLIAPFPQEILTTQDVFFQWTPLQLPIGFDIRYVLEVAAVRQGQLPSEALQSNIAHFYDPNVTSTQRQYPLEAQPLEHGVQYAWRVQALDINGYPVSGNQGTSEIRTFTYDDGSGEGGGETPGVGAPTTFQLNFSAPDPSVTADEPGAFIGAADVSMQALCATRDQWAKGEVNNVLNLPILAPMFGNDVLDVSVYWSVDTSGVFDSNVWALHGRSDTRNWEYFLRGDCDGASDDPGLLGTIARIHWVAARPAQPEFSEYLAAAFDEPQTPQPAHEGIEMSFGTAILSLRPTTVGESTPFQAEQDFFAGHEIDVLPGLNAFGEVWLPEGSLWSWLKQFGWNENKFELQGFVGLSNTVSVGAEYEKSRGGEVDVTLQQKFLELTLLLPKRTPQFLTFIRSMRGGLRFSVEDTLTTGVGPGTETKVGIDLIVKLLWIWEINDDVTITWAGGLDFNTEYQRNSTTNTEVNPETRRNTTTTTSSWDSSKKVDLILSGECDCVWESPLGRGDFWIGNPKLELHYNLSSRTELSIAGSFGFGWGDLPSIVAGGSLSWEAKPDLPSPLKELHAISMQARDDRFAALDRLKMLEADNTPVATLNEARDVLHKAEELDNATWDAYMKAVKDSGTPDIKNGSFDWRHPEWRLRLAAGNVGFAELMDLFRSIW